MKLAESMNNLNLMASEVLLTKRHIQIKKYHIHFPSHCLHIVVCNFTVKSAVDLKTYMAHECENNA